MAAAWDTPFFISSDFARSHAIPTAFAASMGWLSNLNPEGLTYSRKWHLTPEGAIALRNRPLMETPK